jgi:hypothetical protein
MGTKQNTDSKHSQVRTDLMTFSPIHCSNRIHLPIALLHEAAVNAPALLARRTPFPVLKPCQGAK